MARAVQKQHRLVRGGVPHEAGNADNQARMSIQIVDSAGNVFEPVGDFTVKVANADVGDS